MSGAPDRLLPFVATTKERLSISRRTAYELVSAGKLQAVKVGKLTMIRESEVERFIAEAPPLRPR